MPFGKPPVPRKTRAENAASAGRPTAFWLPILCCLALPAKAQNVITNQEAIHEFDKVKGSVEKLAHDANASLSATWLLNRPSGRTGLDSWNQAREKYPRTAALFQPCADILLEAWKDVEQADRQFRKVPIEQYNAQLKRASELLTEAGNCTAKITRPAFKLGLATEGGAEPEQTPGPAPVNPRLQGRIWRQNSPPPLIPQTPALDPSAVEADRATIDWGAWFHRLAGSIEQDFYALARKFPRGDRARTCRIDYTVTSSGEFYPRITQTSDRNFSDAVLQLVMRLRGSAALRFPTAISVQGRQVSSLRPVVSGYFTFSAWMGESHVTPTYAPAEYLTFTGGRWVSSSY